jgi:hypothetical protein
MRSDGVCVNERYEESSSHSPPTLCFVLPNSTLLLFGNSRSTLVLEFVETHCEEPRQRIQPAEYCGCYMRYDNLACQELC